MPIDASERRNVERQKKIKQQRIKYSMTQNQMRSKRISRKQEHAQEPRDRDTERQAMCIACDLHVNKSCAYGDPGDMLNIFSVHFDSLRFRFRSIVNVSVTLDFINTIAANDDDHLLHAQPKTTFRRLSHEDKRWSAFKGGTLMPKRIN